MSISIYPHPGIPSEQQLHLVALIEREFDVRCTDYTSAGVSNFISKYIDDYKEAWKPEPKKDNGGGKNGTK